MSESDSALSSRPNRLAARQHGVALPSGSSAAWRPERGRSQAGTKFPIMPQGLSLLPLVLAP